MPVNDGIDPPNIEGTYLVSPYKLIKSNFNDSFNSSTTFADFKLTFSKQNNANHTVVCSYVNGAETASGLGSVISGTGNNFTVYTAITGTLDGYQFKTVEIYSGEITATGIKNFYHTIIMVEPTPETILIDQARLFYDQDGFSPKQ